MVRELCRIPGVAISFDDWPTFRHVTILRSSPQRTYGSESVIPIGFSHYCIPSTIGTSVAFVSLASCGVSVRRFYERPHFYVHHARGGCFSLDHLTINPYSFSTRTVENADRTALCIVNTYLAPNKSFAQCGKREWRSSTVN
jgi:hypothetical protein